jgi:hypothetical protein
MKMLRPGNRIRGAEDVFRRFIAFDGYTVSQDGAVSLKGHDMVKPGTHVKFRGYSAGDRVIFECEIDKCARIMSVVA